MKNLTAYRGNQIEHFTAIASARRGRAPDVLAKITSYIERAYSRYSRPGALDDLARSRSSLPRTSPEHIELSKCYTSDSHDTVGVADVKASIRAMQATTTGWRCQYCLSINAASTWDHYVMITVHPEYSVFAPNLVPACPECNSLRQSMISPRGKRSTVHLYFDRFDHRKKLVTASLRQGSDDSFVLTLSVSRCSGGPTSHRRLFHRHWHTFRLAARLRTALGRKFEEIAHIMLLRRAVPTDEIVSDLHALADLAEERFGANSLEAIAYRAAASSREFILAAQRGRIPEVRDAEV